VLWVLVLLLLLILVVYFVANSPLAVKKAIDTFAPDYNISYDAIKGNALTGFEILNPRYNNHSLAKEIVVKWNPNTLFNKKIKINKLYLKELNINAINALASQFSLESNSSQEKNSSNSFDFIVELENIELSTQAFEIENVAVSSVSFKSKGIFYKDTQLDIKNFNLDIESNITDISLNGSYENQVVLLKEVKLLNVNILAIQGLIGVEDNSTEEQVTRRETNPLLPKKVNIENTEVTLFPYIYDPVKIEKAKLVAKELMLDVNLKMLIHANLELNATTNLSQLSYSGKIQNNQLLGKLILYPKEALYTHYEIPLRKEAIAQIEADLNVSSEEVVADIRTQGKQILEAKEGDFNIDIDSFVSHVVYDINSSAIHADTKSYITTPYAKDIDISNHLEFVDGLMHHGEIHLTQIEGIEAKLLKPLENLNISYSGDEKSIDTTFRSEQLEGYFKSNNFKVAEVHIETSERLALSSMFSLPPELKNAKAHLQIDAPLNLEDFSHIEAQVKVASNLVDIDANISYAEAIQLDANVVIPKESIIKAYSKELAWDTLSPISTKIVLKENRLKFNLEAETLKSDVVYDLDSAEVNGTLNLAGLAIGIEGNSNEKLAIQTKVTSIKALSQKLNKLYKIGDLPPLEGAIEASIDVDKLKNLELTLTAPKLVYTPDRKTQHNIDDVKLVVSMNEDVVLVKSYQVTFNQQTFFSTKIAKVKLGESINVTNFWINDELKVEGDYAPNSKQGSFSANAKSFHVKDKMVDIYSKIDIKALLDGNNTQVEGEVILLRGKITPNIEGQSFATDSDIRIIQEMKENEESLFMENLSLMLNIKTRQALEIKQNTLNIKLKPDLMINKAKGSDILYLGSVDLLKGSSYIFQEKKFVLGKSAVYFTGNIEKPILDIKANYQALNHLITIGVTGIPAEPNINFSSNPSLTREQILSLILFDSETDGDTHSGNEMMRMMGGAMAKSALSDVGVKVDHLAFGEGNSVEVGKKLTRKITVIYINEELPKVKLKYKHGKRTESVIGVSEESQSYDIIYKRDF